jgi:hypothetical protein
MTDERTQNCGVLKTETQFFNPDTHLFYLGLPRLPYYSWTFSELINEDVTKRFQLLKYNRVCKHILARFWN